MAYKLLSLSAALWSTALAAATTPAAAPMTKPAMTMNMDINKMSSGTVDVNGATVFFKAEGKGQPLLLIHGYPLSGELFKNNRATLSRHFRVITVDLPGFGKSAAPSKDASIQNYAKTMLGFMDAVQLNKAVVGGMSMGGITLLEMWKQNPAKIAGLILIDTVADPASISEAAMWRGTAQQAQEKGVTSLVPSLLPRMLTGVSRAKMPNQSAFLGGLVKQASLNGAVGGANALAERPDALPTLATITAPTLIIVGVEDNLTAPEVAMKMHQGIKGSKLVQIPGAGHAATFEKASWVNRAILDWASAVK